MIANIGSVRRVSGHVITHIGFRGKPFAARLVRARVRLDPVVSVCVSRHLFICEALIVASIDRAFDGSVGRMGEPMPLIITRLFKHFIATDIIAPDFSHRFTPGVNGQYM